MYLKNTILQGNIMMTAVEEWHKLPDSQKSAYKERYGHVMTEYQKDLDMWEKK